MEGKDRKQTKKQFCYISEDFSSSIFFFYFRIVLLSTGNIFSLKLETKTHEMSGCFFVTA